MGLVALATVALLGIDGFGWSASATAWLDALSRTSGGPAYGAMGRLARDGGDVIGLSPATAISALATGLLVAHVTLLLALGRRCLGAAAGWVPAAVVLLWPPSRQALLVISAESLLATAALLLSISVVDLVDRPKRAAIGVAMALLLMVLGHPIGLPALGGLVIIAALWPRPNAAPDVPRQGFASRPIWLGWLAALALFGGLLIISRPGDGLKNLWLACLTALRPTATGDVAGGLADLPLVGATFGLLARMTPAVALLGAAAAVRALTVGRRGPLAPVAAVVTWWLLLVGLIGHPLPGALDPLPVIAPLLALLAAAGAGVWLRGLWKHGHPASRVVAVTLALCLLLSVVVDGIATLPADARTGLGRALPLLHDPAADLPAVLNPDALELLQDQPTDAAILPARRGGDRLANLLTKIGALDTPAHYSAPFSASLMLLRAPSVDPISVFWSQRQEVFACSRRGTFCLHRLRPDKP